MESLSTTLKAIDDEIRALQNEISRLAERLRALKAQRNDTVPVSALPKETLGEIFEYILHSINHNTRQFLPTTQVSQHWRAVALGNPFLWCHIPKDDPPEWVRRKVEISKDVPLHAAFDSWNIDGIPAVFEEISRLKTLDITGRWNEPRLNLFLGSNLASLRAPALKVLQIAPELMSTVDDRDSWEYTSQSICVC